MEREAKEQSCVGVLKPQGVRAARVVVHYSGSSQPNLDVGATVPQRPNHNRTTESRPTNLIESLCSTEIVTSTSNVTETRDAKPNRIMTLSLVTGSILTESTVTE